MIPSPSRSPSGFRVTAAVAALADIVCDTLYASV